MFECLPLELICEVADKCQKSEAEAKFVQFSELCKLVELGRLKYQQYLQYFFVFLITQHDFKQLLWLN